MKWDGKIGYTLILNHIETIDALEAHQPGIFGPNGGYSRAIAVTSMTWMAGLMTGPLLAEFMVGNFGYFELQCVLGEFCLDKSEVHAF